MSESNSTTPEPSGKPAKPYADFPLFAHASGQWAKKIRGKLYYFGKWDNPDAALTSYLEQKDDLHAGRKPREQKEGVTVKELCNAFLNFKFEARNKGELSPRTFSGYEDACGQVVAAFGKARSVDDLRSDDFAALRRLLAANRGPKWLGNTIQNIRCLFRYAYESDRVASPVRFGPEFKRPSQKVLRIQRARQGPNLFAAKEIRQLLELASVPLRAMILLGINAGFGNADCGTLPLSAVGLDNAIIDFPRPKTGIRRRCALWPETVSALRDAISRRPNPKSEGDAGLVFLTRCGVPWNKDIADSPITKELRKILKQLGLLNRKGRGFYTLRHTFRTVADEFQDQAAADFIMGHEDQHIRAVYRETISDERLRALSDHVRAWLFDTSARQPKDEQPEPSLILSEEERLLRNTHYGFGKANYQQVVIASRLMKKGWTDPYYYKGHLWLTSPASRHDRQSRRMLPCSPRPIRITKTGRILRGW